MGRITYATAQRVPRYRQQYLDQFNTELGSGVHRVVYVPDRRELADGVMGANVSLREFGRHHPVDILVSPEAFAYREECFLSILRDHERIHADHVYAGIPVRNQRLTSTALQSASPGMVIAYEELRAYANQFGHLEPASTQDAFVDEVLSGLVASLHELLSSSPQSPLERVLWVDAESLRSALHIPEPSPLT